MQITKKSLPLKRWGFFVIGALILALFTTVYIRTHAKLKDAQDKSSNTQSPAVIDGTSLYPCGNNTIDQCKGAPSIDFWPGGSEDASNPDFAADSGDTNKEIMGRITQTDGNNLILKTSSGRLFTIAYPLDTVANFNAIRASNYNLTVETGDMIIVTYAEQASQQSTTIPTTKIRRSSLLLSDEAANPKQNPGASNKKY